MNPIKYSYPQDWKTNPPLRPLPLKQWKDLKLKIDAAHRRFPEYSLDQISEHFIKSWKNSEKEEFQHWLRAEREQAHNKKRVHSMAKFAYDFSGSKREHVLELKKKLRSRIDSARKLTKRFKDQELLGDEADETLQYIGRILYKLEEEIEKIEAPTLIKARVERTAKMIKKAGMLEVSERLALPKARIIQASDNEDKEQQDDNKILSLILQKLKIEMSALNYHEHLKMLAKIMSLLDKVNRRADSEAVARVIQKDLDGLNSLSNHLAEIYTNINKMPIEEAVKDMPEIEPETLAPKSKTQEKPKVTPKVTKPKTVDIDLPL